MDGQFIFEKLFNEGFIPESKREKEFMESLRDFVYFDKTLGVYKIKKGVTMEENYDEFKLVSFPVLNFVGLFSEDNNYSPSLERVIKKPAIMVKFLGGEGDFCKALQGYKLGKVFNLMVEAFGKNASVEGFRVKLSEEAKELFDVKNKVSAEFATATSKSGKAGDVRRLEFSGIRPTMAKFKLGVDTTFGVIFDLEELKSLKKERVIDKAGL